MEILLFIAVAAGCAAVVHGFFNTKAKQDASWRKMARQLGLNYVAPSLFSQPEMEGNYEGVYATISQFKKGSGDEVQKYTRYTVTSQHIASEVGFAPEGFGSSFSKFFGVVGEDHEVADSAFDAGLVITGNPVHASAIFDVATRRRVRDFFNAYSEGITLENKILTFESSYELGTIPAPHVLQLMVDLAHSFRMEDSEVPERLKKNATGDPNPYVAIRNLEYLMAYPSVANEAARQIVKNVGSPMVQIVAAGLLGREGIEALHRIATTRTAHSNDRMRALHVLTHHAPHPSFEKALMKCLLDPGDTPLRETALQLAAEHRVAAAADYALNSGLTPTNLSEGVSLARLLQFAAASNPQARLLELLEDDLTDIQIAAAESLGVIGSISAVESLMPYTKGMFESSTLKDAAKGAITAIQSRLSGADQGQVSVVGVQDDRGAVSVERTQGEVSLEEEAG